MSEAKETLEKNWYKAVTALKFAKEGLQDFVADQIDTFHRKVYNTVLAPRPTGTSCNSCTLQTVLQCPQNICTSVRKEIIRHHKYGSPSFKNTNPQLWQTSSWETAKCYMAPSGYLDKYTANDTDFTGLISVILNHTDFESAITEDLNQPNNVFEQARDVRNSIMHSSNLQISTTEYKHCFRVLSKVLSDPKQIQALQASNAAVFKLQQLDADQIVISTEDKERIRKEALDAVQSIQDATKIGTQTITDVAEESTKKIRERTDQGTIRLDQKATSGLDKLEEETTRAVKIVIDETSKTKRKISEMTDASEQQVKKIKTAAINDIDSKHQTFLDEREKIKKDIEAVEGMAVKQIDQKYHTIMDETEKIKQDITIASDKIISDLDQKHKQHICNMEQSYIDKTAESLVTMKDIEEESTKKIHEMTDEGISCLDRETTSRLDKLEAATARAVKKTVQDETSKSSWIAPKYSQKDVQSLLIRFYTENGYFKMPVSPLVDDEDVDVETLFAMPLMRIAQHGPKKKKSEKDLDMEINSLKDLFQKKEGTIRRVCLSGDAGHGKTTLCQMIISAWCKIQANEECHKVELPPKDIEFLKSFRYLFYLPLRNLKNLSVVTEMIKCHLVRPIFHSLLDQIMTEESEKCLIILDGLDEWASSGSLPYIDPREEFSVLMTSRAWKLEIIRPKSSDLQQEVQVIGNDQGALLDKLVNFLNEKYHKLRLTSSFFSSLHREVGKLTNIPIIMTHLVCMWYDDRDLGESRVEIFCNLINMLLETADKRINGEETELTTTPKGGLDCFRNLLFCRKYDSVIQTLAKLAFHTLLSKKKEETLVFSQSDYEIHGISQADIELCLKTGILSQSKFIANVSSKSKRLSFLHKSFQESFAAIYIAVDDGCHRLRGMFDKLGSIDDVVEISDVLIYVSGIRPDLVNELSKYIAGVYLKDEIHAQMNNPFHAKSWIIQGLVFKCSAEAYSTSKQTVHVTLNTVDLGHSCDIPIPEKDLIIENIKSYRDTANSNTNLRNICKKNAGGITSYDVSIRSQLQCELIVDMVNRSATSLTYMKIVKIHKTKFDENLLLALSAAHNLTTLTIMPSDDFRNRKYEKETCLTELDLSNNFKLRKLNLHHIYPRSNRVLSLEHIELSSIYVTHTEIETLKNLVFHEVHLKDICLRDITCTTCKKNSCFLALNLSGHTKLQRLEMSNVLMSIPVTSDSGLPSESLIIKDMRFTHTWLEKFGLSLSRQIQMEKLVLYNITCTTCREGSCFIPLGQTKLKRLEIRNAPIYVTSDTELPSESLVMKYIRFTHEGIEKLSLFLSRQTKMSEVRLEHIKCTTCDKESCYTQLDLSGGKRIDQWPLLNKKNYALYCGQPATGFTSLNMSDIRCAHAWIEKLILSVTHQTHMKVLEFKSIICTTCGRDGCFIPLDLSGHSKLQSLEMKDVPMYVTSANELPLRQLILSDIRCTHEGVEKLSLFLSRQTQMEEVRLDHITCTTCDEGSCYTRLDLSGQSRLDTLVMSNLPMSITSETELPLRLPLRDLTLSDIRCTHEGIDKLSLFLSRQTQMRKVRLDHITCTTCDEGSCIIRLDLSGQSRLDTLNMSNLPMSITSDTELPLSSLRLSDIRYTHEGVEKLSLFLSRQTQMSRVHLDNITCTTCDEGSCSIQLNSSGQSRLFSLEMSNLPMSITSETALPLRNLTLKYIHCTHEWIEKLSLFLSCQTQMEVVHLHHITCTTCDEGNCSIQLDLSGQLRLRILEMSNLSMSITSETELPLRDLTLSDIRRTHEGIEKLSLFLSRQTQMRKVRLDHITCTTCEKGFCYTRLDLSGQSRLDDLNMSNLPMSITSDTELPLRSLKLSYIRYTHEGVEKLSLFLSRQTQMEVVELDHITCTTCEKGFCIIQLDLSGQSRLECLNMRNLSMSITSDTELPLEYLKLSYIRYTHEGVEKLSLFLSRQTQMEVVELDHITCTTCEKGSCSIHLDLSGQSRLERLIMSNLPMSITSETELPLRLPLRDLTLSDIRCTHEGVEKLSLFLSRQTQMREVRLDHITCTTCDEGSCIIRLDLSGQSRLVSLEMSNLPMPITSETELPLRLPLRDLTLSDIRCTHEGVEKLSLFLSRQTQLITVHLDHITCTTCEKGSCIIQLDLSGQSRLEFLNMSNLPMSITSETELPLRLPLRDLTLSDIRCTHEGVEKLSLFLSRQTQMREVRLDHITCTTCDEGSCIIRLDLSGQSRLECLEMSNLPMAITSETGLPLRSLRLSDIRCTHEWIEKLSLFLSRQTEMSQVHLDNITCTKCEEGSCRVQLDLSGQSRLFRQK